MMSAFQHQLLIALASIVLVLAVVAAVLFNGNRKAQAETASRGAYIQQSLQLEPIYQSVVRTLAELAVKNNDGQIAELLASQGIRLSLAAAPQAPGAAASAPAPSAQPPQAAEKPAAKPGKK